MDRYMVIAVAVVILVCVGLCVFGVWLGDHYCELGHPEIFKTDSLYCTKCGEQLHLFCPSCDARYYEGWLFCKMCGYKLDN